MLWKFNTNPTRIDKAITEWLQERQELLVLFYKVNGMQPFEDDCLETQAEVLTRFSQVLTDYLSFGHFEVFQKLVKANGKLNSRNISLDVATITELYKNTDIIMSLTKTGKHVMHNLEKLGHQIAVRVDLEDKLVAEYITGKSTLNISSKKQSSL